MEIQKECSEFLDTKHSKAMDADEVYCSKAGKLVGLLLKITPCIYSLSYDKL
jgi:hypothetical protein